jgi:hypothetical protein
MDVLNLQNEAKRAYEHALAKSNLQQQMEARLNVNYNGGFFLVTKELINFLSLYHATEIVILDDYNTPIKVNALELFEKATARYQEIMNEWAEEYEKIKKVRTAAHV